MANFCVGRVDNTRVVERQELLFPLQPSQALPKPLGTHAGLLYCVNGLACTPRYSLHWPLHYMVDQGYGVSGSTSRVQYRGHLGSPQHGHTMADGDGYTLQVPLYPHSKNHRVNNR